MAIPVKQMAVEKAMNLLRAFGWELVRQEMGERDVVITVRKVFTAEELAAAGITPGPGAPS